VIIAIAFLSLYAMQEVSYFSSKIQIEKNLSSPIVSIPDIGVNEKVNFESLNQGILVDELSSEPGKGKIILHGHRTLLGSPFLRLNELQVGDVITLQWPELGEVNYTVNDTYIVSPSHTIPMGNDSNTIYLITCDPIGSTANRLIIEGNISNIGPLKESTAHNNPQEYYGLIIAIAFLGIGLLFSYFYPIKEDKIIVLATVIVISIILFGIYLFPVSPDNFEFLSYLGF
jgi:LPXTG-site transpeptidase (sortase) family protein